MQNFIKAHSRQFSLYFLGGVLSAIADYGSFLALFYWGVWYVAANIWSNIIGFFAAFFLQKTIAFRSGGQTVEHFIRYCVITVVSVLAQTAVLYGLVETAMFSEELAKIASMGAVVLWNYALYKYCVYV